MLFRLNFESMIKRGRTFLFFFFFLAVSFVTQEFELIFSV